MIGRRRMLAALGLAGGSLWLPSLSRRARAASPPTRFLLLYSAQGTVPWRWAANPEGLPDDQTWTSELSAWSETDFSDILAPLHPWRDRVSVVDGLALVSAEADGSGHRHERAQAHSLTGADAAWVGGFPYAGAATIDQRIADVVARPDRYRSIEVSVANGLAYDGYGSVIYRGPNEPVPVIDDPRVLWDRLFGIDGSAGDPVTANQGSVLDAVASRYDTLAGRVSAPDRHKLELHRDLVRSIEQQVQGLAAAACGERPERAPGHGDYEQDLEAHLGLITAAFACDLTRVASIQLGQLGTTQLMAPAGDVHAEYAHAIYENRLAEDVMTEYGRVHAQQLARILATLDAIPEEDGTLLDHTLVVWMSEMADSWHGFDRYPAVVAGGGGIVRLGRWVHYPRDTPYEGLQFTPTPTMGRPHQPLLTTLARAMGVEADAMPVRSVTGAGAQTIDCTGVLPELLS